MKNYSKNLLNNRKYEIPDILNDVEQLNDFCTRNKEKKIVVVQGLGFVGSVMSLVCANTPNNDYAVIGVDLPSKESFWKIQSINEGNFPLVAEDPKIELFFQNTIERGNFYATYDPYAYSFADIIIVDVNLDVQKDIADDFSLSGFSTDLDNFKDAISVIGANCKEEALILVETTVPPGTCLNVVKPTIEKELGKRNRSTEKIKIGHSYERVMPGPEYVDSIRNFPRVFAGIDGKSTEAVELFLKTIIETDLCKLTCLESTTASEMAKVLENSYRATNIAFAVEWSRFAEEAGVNLYEIVNAIRVRKTHSNLMFPNIGVGGYCLTKDPLLASWSRRRFFDSEEELSMSVNSVSINDRMPLFAYRRIKQVFGSVNNMRILFLGVSYRGDVGDTRFTPVETLFELLSKDSKTIIVHDPYVTFWEERNLTVENDLDKAFDDNPELIIVSTAHSAYADNRLVEKITELEEAKIFDAVGLFSDQQLKTLNSRHQVSVLGRGDSLKKEK